MDVDTRNYNPFEDCQCEIPDMTAVRNICPNEGLLIEWSILYGYLKNLRVSKNSLLTDSISGEDEHSNCCEYCS